ncbi:MAG: NAD(P)-dependent oxidoreductase [Pseudomonadota bacterium]
MTPTRIALFERWPHPVAEALLPDYPRLAEHRMRLADAPDASWQILERAHVYQARSTRSELPEQFWVAKPLLDRCQHLLAISTNGSGSDTIDLSACTDAGVLVVNQAGGNKQAVAEHALGMMLCLGKKIIQADRFMRREADIKREQYMGNDALGKTIGIVGLGQVGTHVARLAGSMLSMRVLAYDPNLTRDTCRERGAEQVELAELLAESDYVSVHCPRNASSERMLDADAFAAMKPSAYFITTARGGIHDEMALAAALEAGRLAGAGLDVWDPEPPGPEHPLLKFDNVLVSPHTAGVTHESRENTVRGTIAQIDLIARGERPPRLLNPGAWETYQQRRARVVANA